MSLENKIFSRNVTLGLRVLSVLALAGFALTGWAIGQAPIERQLLVAQKIFYIHLPSAWGSFLGFFVVFVAGIAYLVKRNPVWDALGMAAAEVGLMFTTVVLLTGSTWARTAWGVWWTWDVRLTTMLILWFIYAGYQVLRSAFKGHDRLPVFAAVYGIVGFLDVPIVHKCVELVQTQHPKVLKRSGGQGLDPAMAKTLVISSVVFLAFFALLLAVRLRQELLERRLERLEAEGFEGHSDNNDS